MKRTLRTLLTIAFAVLMLTALALPAAADIIYEPNNLFYNTHREECEYLRVRHYVANSAEGYTYIYQSPDNTLTVRSCPNGEDVAITWLYTAPDGTEWGMVGDESGWIRLSTWSLVYDSREFLKDNEDKCIPYEKDSFEPINGSNGTPVLTWTYPGGELRERKITEGELTEFVSKTYTDENGVVWGYIGYRYGERDFWVCLSAPYDESVGGYALPEHEITLLQPPVAQEDIPVSSGNKTALIVAGVLIVAVVVGTAVIIRTRFTKQTEK